MLRQVIEAYVSLLELVAFRIEKVFIHIFMLNFNLSLLLLLFITRAKHEFV